jgi:hypothetical protein
MWGPRATHFTGYCCWFLWGLGQHTLLGIVVGLCGGLWRHTSLVLLLDYVGPRATHLTVYCWFMWHLGQHTLLGIVGLYGVLLLVMLRLRQHTLLAIVVGLWGASDNTLYWVLLWVMRGFGQHTLLDIIRSDVGRLHQWVQNNFFLNNSVKKLMLKCRFPYTEANIHSQKITCHCFPVS